MVFNSILSLGAAFCYVINPVVDMREMPTIDSEIVSQAFYSESVTIEKESGDWILIKSSDGYSGWIKAKSLITLTEAYQTELKTSRLSAHVYQNMDTTYGPLMTLPFGSRLHLIDDTDVRWVKISLPDGRQCYIQKGDVAPIAKFNNMSDLLEFSLRFEGLPYTWGGRSSFGFDCSGFVQFLYRELGIELKRDARQQILDDRFEEVSIDRLQSGDLIFFGSNENQIRHVGVYLYDGRFIHATTRENQPWIRISSLEDSEWNGTCSGHNSYRTFRSLKPLIAP